MTISLTSLCISKILNSCRKIYVAITYTKSFSLPEETTYIWFQNFERLLKAAFVIFADFKTISNPVIENNNDGPNNNKYQDRIACTYG